MSTDKHIIDIDVAPTLAMVFRERVRRTPEATAYTQFGNDQWTGYSWRETLDEAARWQAAMQRDGLVAGERVAIMCSNRREWVLLDQAAQGLGLITVPVYTNDRAENIRWILQDSGASLLLIEKQNHWQALGSIHDDIEQLKRVVCLEELQNPTSNTLHLSQWLQDGAADYICQAVEPTDMATIVYTSGTTGRPKGVMLSHDNMLRNIHASLDVVSIRPDDLFLSFLPLSHTLERTAGYYLPMVAGAPVTFNRNIPLLGEDLLLVKPTVMVSVPRIFERVYGRIMLKLQQESSLKQLLFRTAITVGWQKFLNQQGRAGWSPGLLLQALLDRIVGAKVRAKLGGRLRVTVCGGAALSEDVARLFISLGIPVIQGYGLTETSPVIAVNRLEDNEPSSVGQPLDGVEIKLGPHSELLTRGPCVMLGYWNNPQATAQIIDQDGWLHTGDKVAIDDGGHISITGRMKEIIVLSTGEKVPPSDMENAIVLDELVDQVIVVGEGKPYLSALVVPNQEAFERVARQLDLDPADKQTCQDKNLSSLFMQHVQNRISMFPGYAQVRKLAVVNEAWTPDNGLITPTMKLRRKRILDHYKDITEELYAGH